MAEDTPRTGDLGRRGRSAEGFAGTIGRKAVEPVATAAATAGAAYLARKSSLVWREKIAPKLREQGGARAVLEGTVKRASEKLEQWGSTTISPLRKRISNVHQRYSEVPLAALQAKPRDRREKERVERQRRRNERQRALRRSGSS